MSSHVYRQSTQLEILRRDHSQEIVDGLQSLASNHANVDVRVAAIFTLKQWLGAESHGFLAELTSDESIREHALHALADRIKDNKTAPSAPFLKALSDDNPRVRIQGAIGLGRLGQPQHAKAIIPLTADNDPLVAHAAVNALVKLEAVTACLNAVKQQPTPIAEGALLALSQLHVPNAADGLCELALQQQGKPLYPAILTTLCHLYHLEGEWTGSWWGTRPDTTGPYYKPTSWSHSQKIEQVLRHAAATGDAETATLLRKDLPRHRIKLDGLKFNEGQGVVPPEVLVGLPQLGAEELAAVAQLARAADTKTELRIRAIEALRRQGAKINDIVTGLITLARSAKQPGEAMLTRLSFVYDPANQSELDYFIEQAQSDDENVRSLAYGVLLAQQSSSLADADLKEKSGRAIENAWKSSHTTASLLTAIGELGATEYANQIAAQRENADANVKKAAESAHASIQNLLAPNATRIADLTFENIQEQVGKESGDPQLGAQLFVRQQCISCHTVSSTQTPVGPFLGGITQRYKTHELVESIVKPDAKVSQGFATQVFITVNGKSITGFVVRDGADTVEIRDNRGRRVILNKDDIDERVEQKTSMMPKGLVDKLTPQQLASLLAYLGTLKGK